MSEFIIGIRSQGKPCLRHLRLMERLTKGYRFYSLFIINGTMAVILHHQAINHQEPTDPWRPDLGVREPCPLVGSDPLGKGRELGEHLSVARIFEIAKIPLKELKWKKSFIQVYNDFIFSASVRVYYWNYWNIISLLKTYLLYLLISVISSM